MNREQADRWLGKQLESHEITGVVEGTANLNFFVTSDKNYVLRVSRDVSEDRLENEYRMLEFLKKQGTENVPRPVEIDSFSGSTVVLETAVGDRDVDLAELEREDLEKLAARVADIHSIPVEKYNSFSGSGERPRKTLKEVFRKDFRDWSKPPYTFYMENVENPDPRLKKFYQKQKELVENAPETEVRLGVIHGDLGSNVRKGDGEIFIVDWEFGRTGYPGNELLYMFEHGGMGKAEKEIFLDTYRKHRDPRKGFEEAVEIYPRALAFNDAAWAAKRYAKTGEEKYRELLDRRLEKLEELY